MDSHFADSGTLVVTAGATESGGFAATLDSHGAVLLADGAGSDDQHQSLTVAKVLVDNPSSAPTAAIDLLYQQLLGRAPDAAGVAYWTAQIAGGTSISKVAADFLNSAEYLERTIGQDYHDLLHRAADAQGLSFFVSRVQAGGMDLDQVADDLLASSELWQASGATPSRWVEALYTRVLGRPADAAGSQYFIAQLDAQTLSRRQVAAMVLASPEDFARDVAGWYEQFLGRAPSAAEQAVAVSALAAGESAPSIIAALIGGANSR